MKITNSGRGHGYTQEEIEAVIEAMNMADPYTQGKYQKEFEEKFAEYIGTDSDCYAVATGTSALELSAILSGLKDGDEVIIPAHTFTATAIPFGRTGANIVWADIDPNTFVISAESVESLITSKTKAIVVVHLYGVMCDMEAIMSIANKYNIKVIEDCAQALGSKQNGKQAGTFGDFACYSFHSHKHLTTLGEGGMFVIKDKELSKLVSGIKHNGLRGFDYEREKYWKPAMSNVDFDIDGFWPYNFCIGEVQCAVGTKLLQRVDSLIKGRVDRATKIIEGLRDCDELRFQHTPEGFTNAYYTLPAYVDNKSGFCNDDLIELLYNKYNIMAIVQYHPLNRYPMYQKAGFGEANIPYTDEFFDNMIALPNHGELTDEEVSYMIESIKSAIKELRK
jgi:dTDP-4-amino-4,6-dideoxygalactose transaminase